MSTPARNAGCCWPDSAATRPADTSTTTNDNRLTSGSSFPPSPVTTHRHAWARRRHLGSLGSNERLWASVHNLVLRRQLSRQPLQRVVEPMRAEQRDALTARMPGA